MQLRVEAGKPSSTNLPIQLLSDNFSISVLTALKAANAQEPTTRKEFLAEVDVTSR